MYRQITFRSMTPTEKRTNILGIGNILWADDGFGVRAVERLHERYEFPEQVQLIDGGTQGINLLPYVEEAEVLVLFDAVDFGLTPGTLKVVEGEAVPQFMGAKKLSLHQSGFQEVLALAALAERSPEHMVLIGVQPEILDDYGGSLSPAVKARLPEAVEAAVAWLERLGIHAEPRPARDDGPAGALHAESVALESYERGRPSATEAPRLGDPRVLSSGAVRFDPKPEGEQATLTVPLDRPRRTL